MKKPNPFADKETTKGKGKMAPPFMKGKGKNTGKPKGKKGAK